MTHTPSPLPHQTDAPSRGGRPAPVVERRALRDGVYEAVLELLLDNRFAPGDSLSIDGLARELGVSPTPVREALALMENTGLVSRAALKGYRVAPPLEPQRMRELLEARTVLEEAAVRRAVPVSDDLLERLEAAHARHGAAAERVTAMRREDPEALEWDTLRAYYSADWDFHVLLLLASGNQYLLQLAQSLYPVAHRLRQSVQQGRMDVEDAHVEHGAVLEAVRSGDSEAAAAAMAAHLSGVAARALSDH